MKKKNNLKRLGTLFVSLSMLIPSTAVMASAGVVTDNEVVFSDDFESYNDFGELSPKWYIDGNCDGCGIETVGGKKGIYFTYSSGASPTIAMAKDTFADDISDGTVRISFDLYLENTNDEIWSFLDYVQSSSQEDYGAYQFITIHKPAGGSAYVEGIEVDTAKWYNVVMDLNLGENNKWSYGIGIYDTDGNLVGSTGKSKSELMGTFRNINFTAWKSGKVYIDDVSVKKINRGLPFFDDMNSYCAGDSKPALIDWTTEGYDDGTTGFEAIDSEHGMTAYVSTAAAPVFAPYRLSDPVSEGKLKLEFDTYITNEAELWNRVTVVPSDSSDFGANGVLNIDCQPGGTANVTTSSITPVANNVPVNAWYKVKMVFDLDTKTYTTTLYNAAGEVVGAPVTEANAASMLNNISTVNFTTWKDGKFYFDNVNLSITDEESVRPDPVLPLTDNFEGYADINAMADKWVMDDTTKALSGIETVEGRGKVFRLGLNSATDNTIAYRRLPFTLTGGAVNISFSMKPAENASVPVMLFNAERSNFLPVMFVSGGGIFCNTTNASGDKPFEYTPGEWYDFNVYVDAANRRYRLTMTDMSGASNTSDWFLFDNFKFNDRSLDNVGSINFQIWQNKDDSAYFDNLRIYYDEAQPVLSERKVQFLDAAGNDMGTDLAAVSTETSLIKLDFGVGMDSWYFDSDNVKIINKATGDELAYDAETSGNEYIIHLKTPLGGTGSYTLFVSGAVDSLARVALGSDFTMDFLTAGGYASGGVSYNNGVITAVMTNTTAAAKDFYIVYTEYTGKKMTAMRVKRISVAADTMNEAYAYDVSSYIGTGFDKAKAFLWDADTFAPVADTEVQ